MAKMFTVYVLFITLLNESIIMINASLFEIVVRIFIRNRCLIRCKQMQEVMSVETK